jgi:uncharacterized protein YcaQ
MVAGRVGNERLWDLAERVVPGWRDVEPLDATAFAERRVLTAVRRLGVATGKEIVERVPYVDRATVMAVVERDVQAGRLAEVRVDDADAFIRVQESRPWRPQTTLLSPFDPVIADRDRTQRLFGFRYRLEMYVPREKREYGHFVLPILHGDRLIGRIDPLMDRRAATFRVNALHLEPDAPRDAATGKVVAGAIASLASWLGAREIAYGDVPRSWRRALAASAKMSV